MTEKEILNQLKEYQKTKNPFIIDKLIYDLEHITPIKKDDFIEQRTLVEKNYQTNQIFSHDTIKQEIIHKIFLFNQFQNNEKWAGYRINQNGEMEITNGSCLWIIHPIETPFPKRKEIPNLENQLQKELKQEKYAIDLNIDEIKKHYEKIQKKQTEKYLYSISDGLHEVIINIFYLMDTIQLLGEKLTCFIVSNNFSSSHGLYLINQEEEKAFLCGIQCYSNSIDIIQSAKTPLKQEKEKKVNLHEGYTIVYKDENQINNQLRYLKKFNMLAYKEIIFQIFPNMRSGVFPKEKIIEKNSNEKQYELKTDAVFRKIHGPIVMHYQIEEDTKTVLIDHFSPENVIYEDYNAGLNTYKGVPISKKTSPKDMFKIDLLNNLYDKNK